jgi:hypothetical protein
MLAQVALKLHKPGRRRCAIIKLDKEGKIMCRNIKVLFNFEPPATDEEIKAAALQYVRKVSGFHSPSKVNEAAFNKAIDEIAKVTSVLFSSLTTEAHSHNREEEAAKAHARALERFGKTE